MNILITGTSKGIGYALAEHFIDTGDFVWGVSRSFNQKLAGKPNFSFLQTDISDFVNIKADLRNFISKIETYDLVVLNAGVLSPIADLHDTSIDTLKQVMEVNVWANKLMIDCLVESCSVKQIVAISSGAAVSGNRGWNAYAISKAALNMLMRLYGEEFPNIHFSALAPGLVDTQMQEYISALPEDVNFPVISRLKQAKGTKDMPSPELIAPKLVAAFTKLKQLPSGSFSDIRKLI
jgi:NAD(P)-dependent dehydrogenase (short-subunit alcohol dehydrogenase family)